MRSINSQLRCRKSRGFSLLEMVVAVAILGLAMGALYQAASGATRNVRVDEKYAYAVELARSLLADNHQVPLAGKQDQGKTAGDFSWQLSTRPVTPVPGASADVKLHEIEVTVSWLDGEKQRKVSLNSVVEGRKL
jgi:general secretion pathway protein I